MHTFQGDPKIYLLPGGIEIKYYGGQPKFDSGIENLIMIILFSEEDWPVNNILSEIEKIGSSFLSECRKPITATQIRKIEIEAKSTLSKIEAIGLGQISDLSVRMVSQNQIKLKFVLSSNNKNKNISINGFDKNWQMLSEEI